MNDAIAERIAERYNALRRGGLCRGVLVFSPQGWDLRWHEEPYGLPADRVVIVVRDGDLTPAEAVKALAAREEAVALWEREREAAMARSTTRAGEAESRYGMASGAFNCQSCGSLKPEPASVCGVCGNDPVSHGGDRMEFNRAHGYVR